MFSLEKPYQRRYKALQNPNHEQTFFTGDRITAMAKEPQQLSGRSYHNMRAPMVNWTQDRRSLRTPLLPVILVFSSLALSAQPGSFSFEQTQALLKTYCKICHQGPSPAGGFNVEEVATTASLHASAQRWIRI